MSPRAWLFSLEQIGIKLGLAQIRALVAALDGPDRTFRSIVIAGTNGKGSVVAMVERALRAAGYRTGRYTSPHLSAIEERVAIDGATIDAGAFDALAARVAAAAARLPHPPSFFEATTALALEAFREARVEVAVLEVGLGGRLDATNVVTPIGVAIAAIDLDHQEHLGDTIEAIAREKAGVIKPGAVVAVGRNPPAARAVIDAVCRSQQVVPIDAPDRVRVATAPALVDGRVRLTRLTTPTRRLDDVTLALRGRHQVDNAITATALLDGLAERGALAVSDTALRTGLASAAWPGRLESVSWRGRALLVDGAHNPAGARALASYLTEVSAAPVPIVIGVMQDKDAAGIVAALAPVASAFICTAASTPRALSPDALAAVARAAAPAVPAHAAATIDDALARAATLSGPVVVAGSLYLAGEVRARAA